MIVITSKYYVCYGKHWYVCSLDLDVDLDNPDGPVCLQVFGPEHVGYLFYFRQC